jgi:transposase
MSDLYWLTDQQMAKLAPFFPESHGKASKTRSMTSGC